MDSELNEKFRVLEKYISSYLEKIEELKRENEKSHTKLIKLENFIAKDTQWKKKLINSLKSLLRLIQEIKKGGKEENRNR